MHKTIIVCDSRIQRRGREEILPQLLGEAPSVCSALSDKVK